MKKNKIILAFARLTDLKLEEKAKAICCALDGNSNFPTPNPCLAELKADIVAFSEALATSNGNIKKDKRIYLEDTLSSLAHNVSFVANNDYDKLVSSGYNVHKGKDVKQTFKEAQIIKRMPQKNANEIVSLQNNLPCYQEKQESFFYRPAKTV